MKNTGASKPIFWRQGLFMRPQHLQLDDLRVHGDLAARERFLHPHPRGAASLKLAEEALSNETIHVVSGEFRFGDGTFAAISENAVVSPRSFKEVWNDRAEPFGVHIGVRRYDLNGKNVAVAEDGATPSEARFVVAEDSSGEIPDLYYEGPKAHIERLDLQLKIFFDPEVPLLSEYELLRVAELVMIGDEVRVSERFAPPSLRLSASPMLVETTERARQRIVSAAARLEEHKFRTGVRAADYGAGDIAWLLALRSLNRAAAELTHLSEADAHPWDVYGVLRRTAAELSTFSVSATAIKGVDGRSAPPPYDHDRPGQCFSAVVSLLSGLLREIAYGPDYVIVASLGEEFHSFRLKPEYFEDRRFYLAAEGRMEPEEILKSVEIDLKLGSASDLPDLVLRALPGLGLEYLREPPPALPRRAGRLYFRIEQHGELWDAVERERVLAMDWDLVPETVKVELIPLKEEK